MNLVIARVLRDYPTFRVMLPMRCRCGNQWNAAQLKTEAVDGKVYLKPIASCGCGAPDPRMFTTLRSER